jgi:hypothetical protein
LGRRQQKIKKLQWAVDENDEEKWQRSLASLDPV